MNFLLAAKRLASEWVEKMGREDVPDPARRHVTRRALPKIGGQALRGGWLT